jgi:hypothetical protein
MTGCWQDLRGWRGDGRDGGTAGWEEGIGRNSHMLELQELGEYNKNVLIPVLSNDSSSLTHDI